MRAVIYVLWREAAVQQSRLVAQAAQPSLSPSRILDRPHSSATPQVALQCWEHWSASGMREAQSYSSSNDRARVSNFATGINFAALEHAHHQPASPIHSFTPGHGTRFMTH